MHLGSNTHQHWMTCVLIALALCTFSVTGCGEVNSSADGSAHDAAEPAASDTPTSKEVSKLDYGRHWPLTVDSGTIRCEGSSGAGSVLFDADDGTTYAVNGTAQAGGGPEIDEIWKDAGDGMKVDIGPILDEGLALCAE
jgi:hypothetical protein